MLTLGDITLNLSFVLYLVLYFPQLWRNIKYKKLSELSFAFHALLFIAATADLYYGFGRIQQWQYRTVSLVMFACLLTQHIQLFFYQNKSKLILLSILIFIMLLGFVYIKLYGQHVNMYIYIYVLMGWVERIGYWLYLLPQIIKNQQSSHLKASRAISPLFVSIGLLTAILDSVSAWSFSWASPSLYGAPIAVLLHVWILVQCVKDQVQKLL